MATELSNYDNDYRVRYRITATTDLLMSCCMVLCNSI